MPAHDQLAVTMTGELCDCYADRRAGVRAILKSVRAAAAGSPVRLWTTPGRFFSLAQAAKDPLSAASANWLALSHFVARQFPRDNVLLLDIGSTTTDVTYLRRGRPMPRRLTDQGRLRSGELVYTGVRRTPICALITSGIAAELFATTLDAYVTLGLMPEDGHDCATADGRPATRPCAAARLARMVGADAGDLTPRRIRQLAVRATRAQQTAILAAADRVVAGRPLDRLVLAGAGEFVGRLICGWHAPWRALTRTSLAELLGPALSAAACAHAVAMLAFEELVHG
jgi:hypothetical protein